MSDSRKTSIIFSHIKRFSNGDSISLSFLDFFTFDTSDISLFDTIQVKIIFKVKALTQFGSEIKLSGNIKELGNWDLNSAVSLYTTTELYPIWLTNPITVTLQSLPFSFEYKYIMLNTNTKSAKWEAFSKNRILTIKDRCSFWNSYFITDTFGTHSKNEIELKSQNDTIAAIQEFFKSSSTQEILEKLAVLIEEKEIDFTLLHIAAIVLRALSAHIKEMIKDFSAFILRCMKKLNMQQTKMILSLVHIPEIELINPSSNLVDSADICENSIENLDEDLIVNYNISALRSTIYTECRSFTNSIALMLTDNNLEKKEVELIERILENIEGQDPIWKIALLGKWICEMLFYHSIRLKQVNILKSQFEKLEKSENLEVLKDLLYELMDLIVEEYCQIASQTNHFDCESLAKGLNVEYGLIYYEIFLLASKFISKSIPIVARTMNGPQYLCFSQGVANGFLFSHSSDQKIPQNAILLINKPDEYIELHPNVTGIIVGTTENFLVPLLVSARCNKVPVTIGFLPQLSPQEHVLIANEDFFSLAKV